MLPSIRGCTAHTSAIPNAGDNLGQHNVASRRGNRYMKRPIRKLVGLFFLHGIPRPDYRAVNAIEVGIFCL